MNLVCTIVKPKGTWRFVSDSEPLRRDDLVRETIYPNYTDSVISDYVDKLNWASVAERLPAWVGSTLNEYMVFAKQRPHYFEVIRKVKD